MPGRMGGLLQAGLQKLQRPSQYGTVGRALSTVLQAHLGIAEAGRERRYKREELAGRTAQAKAEFGLESKALQLDTLGKEIKRTQETRDAILNENDPRIPELDRQLDLMKTELLKIAGIDIDIGMPEKLTFSETEADRMLDEAGGDVNQAIQVLSELVESRQLPREELPKFIQHYRRGPAITPPRGLMQAAGAATVPIMPPFGAMRGIARAPMEAGARYGRGLLGGGPQAGQPTRVPSPYWQRFRGLLEKGF